jgi:hypothetical protein
VQGKALLSASIFSEDPADFTCARDKALERYKQLAKIYIKRSTVLAGSLTRPSCNLVHTTATSILTNTLTPLLNPNPISLSDQNYIAQQNSCPLIY